MCQENQKKSLEALQYFSVPQMFLRCSSDVHIPSQTALSYFPLYIVHTAQHYFNVQPSYTDNNANDTLIRSHYRSLLRPLQTSVFLLIAAAIGQSNALTSDCCFPCWLIKAQEMGTARAGHVAKVSSGTRSLPADIFARYISEEPWQEEFIDHLFRPTPALMLSSGDSGVVFGELLRNTLCRAISQKLRTAGIEKCFFKHEDHIRLMTSSALSVPTGVCSECPPVQMPELGLKKKRNVRVFLSARFGFSKGVKNLNQYVWMCVYWGKPGHG